MGSPTSDDDQTRPVPGSGGPVQGGGQPQQEQETTRFAAPPGEPQRGQTAPFPQAGGYPQGGPYPPGSPYPAGGPYRAGGPGGYPPGPGGPYPPSSPGGYPPQGPYGYGAPPPGGQRSNRGLVIALIAALVVLAGVAVALVIAYTRDEGDTVSAPSTTGAAPSLSPSPSPSPSPSSSPSPSGSTSAAPPSPTGSAGDRTEELLATVPLDFTDCAETELAGDGDVAAVDCGASATQPGPQRAQFYLYDDTATLDEVFAEEAGDLDPMPDAADCTTAQGVTTWNAQGSTAEGGAIACTITDDGVLIAWTDREFGIEGVVTAPGTTQEELATLADWWLAHSDFQS